MQRKCASSKGYALFLTDLFAAQAHATRIFVDKLLELVQLPRWPPDSFVRHGVYPRGGCESRSDSGRKSVTGSLLGKVVTFRKSDLQLFPTGASQQLGTS
jgi:hypothetical protein